MYKGMYWERDQEQKLSSRLQKGPLELLYCEADKLLDALPVLLLSGAAAVVLTWLTHGRLWFPHLLVHSRQTQPGDSGHKQRQRSECTYASVALWGLMSRITGRYEGVILAHGAVNRRAEARSLTGWRCQRWRSARRCSRGRGPARPPPSATLLSSGTDTPGCGNQKNRTRRREVLGENSFLL